MLRSRSSPRHSVRTHARCRTRSLDALVIAVCALAISQEAVGLNTCYSLALSPNGKRLAAGAYDVVQLYDFENGAVGESFDGFHSRISSLAFGADGVLLAIAPQKGTATIADLASDNWEHKLRDPRSVEQAQWAVSVAFSPDGSRLVTGSSYLRLWDVSTGALVKTGEIDDSRSTLKMTSFGGIKAVYSPNGKTIATASYHNGIHIYEAATLRFLGQLGDPSKPLFAIAYSPNGKTLATGGETGKVDLWDLTTKERRNLTTRSEFVLSLAFSKDGKWLASGGGNRDKSAGLVVWNVSTGSVLHDLKKHSAIVSAVAFTPDGKFLVSCAEDGVINVWNPLSGKLLRSIPASSGLTLQ